MELEKFLQHKIRKDIIKKHPNAGIRRQYIREIITDDLIRELYYDKGYSANYISHNIINAKSSYFRSCASVIIERIKQMGLNPKTILETNSDQKTLDLRKQTLLNRYGVTHPSQLQTVKDSKKQKCLATYGYDNNFKVPEIKRRIKEWWVKATADGKAITTRSFSYSKPHLHALELLKQLNVSYTAETQKGFAGYNPIHDKWLYPRVDIFIPDKHLVIEINGIYWHADPRKYKAQDIFYTWKGKQTAEQLWLKDKIKIDHLKNLGYNVEVIWEDAITIENIKHILSKYEDIKNNKVETSI